MPHLPRSWVLDTMPLPGRSTGRFRRARQRRSLASQLTPLNRRLGGAASMAGDGVNFRPEAGGEGRSRRSRGVDWAVTFLHSAIWGSYWLARQRG